jgi:hypothetical protein
LHCKALLFLPPRFYCRDARHLALQAARPRFRKPRNTARRKYSMTPAEICVWPRIVRPARFFHAVAGKIGKNLFVSDGDTSVLLFANKTYKPEGAISEFSTPDGLWIDKSGNLYVSAVKQQEVEEFAPRAKSAKHVPGHRSGRCYDRRKRQRLRGRFQLLTSARPRR